MPKASYESGGGGGEGRDQAGSDLGDSSLRIKKDKPKRLPVAFWRSQDRRETMNDKDLS